MILSYVLVFNIEGGNLLTAHVSELFLVGCILIFPRLFPQGILCVEFVQFCLVVRFDATPVHP